MSRWATRRRDTGGMASGRASCRYVQHSGSATPNHTRGFDGRLRARASAVLLMQCYARPGLLDSWPQHRFRSGLSVSTGTLIRLASADDALTIARMSRDLIEQGLGWSWTPLRVRRSIAEASTNVALALHGATPVGFGIMKYR